jgi:hypothetical protein
MSRHPLGPDGAHDYPPGHTLTDDQLVDWLGDRPKDENPPRHGLRVSCLADVEPEKVDWLWSGRIPLGMLSEVTGDCDLGKSTLLLDIGARRTKGTPMPGESSGAEPSSVVILTAEDALGAVVRPRLDAAGADVSRVHAVTAAIDEEGHDRPPAIPIDLQRIEALIGETGARLVIVDPLTAYLGSGIDAFRDHDVRRALMPLSQLAERTGAAIVMVRHLRKSGTGKAVHAAGGSVAITAATRASLLCAKDPEDENDENQTRLLARAKCNLSPPVPTLRYRLVGRGDVAVVEWLGIAENVTADALVSAPGGEDKTPIEEAAEILRDMLADEPVAVDKIRKAANGSGIGWRTFERAKARLGIRSVKPQFGGGWDWELPAKTAKTATHGEWRSSEDGDAENGGRVAESKANEQDRQDRHRQDRQPPVADFAAPPEGCPDCGSTMRSPGVPGCLCEPPEPVVTDEEALL